MKDKIQLYREARLWLTQVILPLAGIAYRKNGLKGRHFDE